jgi:hypothetical protein
MIIHTACRVTLAAIVYEAGMATGKAMPAFKKEISLCLTACNRIES